MNVNEPTAKRKRMDEFDMFDSLNVVSSVSSSRSESKIVADAFITSYTPEDAVVETTESTSAGVVLIPDFSSEGDEEGTAPVEKSKEETPVSSSPTPDENGV